MSAGAKTAGRVAAFFDLDGTLLPEPSLERRFFSALRRNDAIPPANYLRWGLQALRLLPNGLLAVQHRNKRYLTGVSCDLVFRYMESVSFFEEGIARVAWHARQGHEIVLVSGTLESLAHLAATALECELEARGLQIQPHVCATRLAEVRGQWTGYVIGEVIYGPAKARALEELAKTESLDLRHCHAYGNTLLDRQLLSAVGHGHAVNPGKDLAALANEKDWPIWHWYLERKLNSKAITRVATGIQQVERQA
jgi:HAD superfamily hydrolase (TIGR01490 family)